MAVLPLLCLDHMDEHWEKELKTRGNILVSDHLYTQYFQPAIMEKNIAYVREFHVILIN